MNITIRKAKPDEWKILQRLNNEVFIDNAPYDTYLNLEYPFSPEGISYYKKTVSSRKNYCIFAMVNREAVGYLVGHLKQIAYRTVKTAEITELGVSPNYQSQGIGAQLVSAFRAWAKEKNCQTLFVQSYFSNERAIQFYKKQKLFPIDISLEGNI